MYAKLRQSALLPRHATLLRMEPLTEKEAALAGVVPAWAGFRIPYFSPSGKVLDFYRYRFWPESRPTSGWASLAIQEDGQKELRYVQPASTAPHVYLPPLLSTSWKDILSDPHQPLCITEGEIKAACGCAHGITTLGLGAYSHG